MAAAGQQAPSGDAEHGMFPSAKESSDDAHPTAFTFGGDKVEKMVEHGSFPSTKVANGVESTEPIPKCSNDDMVPIPCEHESHLAHLSESASELSASTICEIECFLFEGMSDTPHRSSEAISISNNLPSTSSVFTHVVLGSMGVETPSHDMMVPIMEKMYMEDEDDATPCLYPDEQVGHDVGQPNDNTMSSKPPRTPKGGKEGASREWRLV